MKKKILIVDDSATIRSQLVSILSGEFDCVTAENGQDGFDKALASPPAAMVVDLEMPVMNGVELLRMLGSNARTKGIPVVVATTVTGVELVNQCRSLGCSGYVLKPVQGDYLIAKLKKLVTARTAA